MGTNHSHRPIAMEGLSLSSSPFSTVNLTLSTGRSLLEVFLIISLMRSSRPTSSSMEISKTALFWKTRGQGSRGDLGSWLIEPCHLWNMLCNWRISTLSRANGLIANELSQLVRSQKTKRHWLLKSRRVCNHLALNSKWPLASKLILALLKTCIRIRPNNLTLSEQHLNPYPQGPQAKQGIFNLLKCLPNSTISSSKWVNLLLWCIHSHPSSSCNLVCTLEVWIHSSNSSCSLSNRHSKWTTKWQPRLQINKWTKVMLKQLHPQIKMMSKWETSLALRASHSFDQAVANLDILHKWCPIKLISLSLASIRLGIKTYNLSSTRTKVFKTP